MKKKQKLFWRKFFSLVTGLALVAQSYLPLFNFRALAQEITPTLESTPESTITLEPTPEVTITPELTPEPTTLSVATPEATIIPTPTEEIILTPTPDQNQPTPTSTEPPKETGPPAENPTEAPASPTGEILDGASTSAIEIEQPETGVLSAVILENVAAPSLDLDNVDPNNSATLTTDKADYAPTDTVVITGSGFKPGENYTLIISSTDEPPVIFETQVTSDEQGNFIYAYQLDGNYRPNYKIEAKDSSGKIIATASFLDHSDMDVNINNGDASTGDLNVTLSISWTGSTDPTQARYANDTDGGSCPNSGSSSWTTWEAISDAGGNTATKTWTLAAGGAGERKVCVETKHGVGTTKSASDTIWYPTATLPSDVQLYQWETVPAGNWITGNLGASNSDYKEGETVPFKLDVGGIAAGSYAFSICQDYSNGTKRGYLRLNPYNTSRAASSGGAISSTNGNFSGVNVTIDSVNELNAQGACGSGQRETQLQITTSGSGTANVLWGGYLASPIDAGVGAGNGAASYPGSSLHMKLLSPNKDRSINPNAIIQLATITVQKIVDSGSASPNQWGFNLSPNPNSETLPKYPSVDTVTFLSLNTGSYQITETSVSGYSFASGSGTNCTFSGSTATASVVAGTTATNATCVFHNSQQTGTIIIVKETEPNDEQDFSFTGDLGNFSLDDDADGTLANSQTFNVTMGTYSVIESISDGWSLTDVTCIDPTSNSSGNLPTAPSATINLAAGETVTCTFTNTKLREIKACKFNDLDGDGITDDSEGLLDGWQMTLNPGNVTQATVNGCTTFTSLLPDNYSVTETGQTDWTNTTPVTQNVTLTVNQNETVYFGNFACATISGTKWEDLNGNGQRDEEDNALADWTINLAGPESISTTTDADGNYSFKICTGGNYTISETLLDNNWYQTFPGETSPNHQVTVTSGSNHSGKDFGNTRYAKISGFKYRDNDGDGVLDADDLADTLGGWVIDLYNGATNTIIASTTTVTGGLLNGYYEFTGLLVNQTYYVLEQLIPSWSQTYGPTPIPTPMTLQSGENKQVDFANFKNVSISGQKFNDLNDDGDKDGGESGLVGWTINLDTNADGSIDATTTTDGSGNYTFTNLEPGIYRIREAMQTGWTQTTDDPDDITVSSGQNVSGVDFGNFKLGVIQSRKYEDLNGNSNKDGNESWLSGWTIRLYNGDWSFNQQVDTGHTGILGQYRFENLPLGTYYICEVLQDGWAETDPSSIEGFTNLSGVGGEASRCRRFIINQSGDETIGQKHFGNSRLPQLTVTKVVINDNGGAKEVTDFPLFVDGNPVTSGITSAYKPDNYLVTETQTDGYQATIGGDCDAQGNVSLAYGDNKTCTITNNDIQPQFTLTKVVSGGSAQVSDFTLYINGIEVTSGQTNSFNAGNYTISESGPDGHTASFSGDCDLQGNFGLVVGDPPRSCTITNTRDTGTITVDKVTDPSGSSEQFTINLNQGLASDPTLIHSSVLADQDTLDTFSVPTGNYWFEELAKTGWELNDAVCTDGDVSFDPRNDEFVVTKDLRLTCTFTNLNLGSIQGKKFDDKNGNGTRQGGDTWLDGWTIKIYEQGDGWQYKDQRTTGHTGTLGQYRFENLSPGNYLVCEEVKNGWMQTGLVGSGGRTTSPSGDGTQCFEISLTAGDQLQGFQFGNLRLGRAQGMKYDDTDGDGLPHESGESFLNEWTIRLYQDWQEQTEVVTSNTGTTGQYRFSDLQPGTYQVCEVLNDGWTQTWPKLGDYPIGDNGVIHSDYGQALENQSGAEDEGPICWQTVIDRSGDFNQLLRFGNTNYGHLIVQKTTDPVGDQTFFEINATGTGSIKDANLGTISDDQNWDYTVAAGTYSVAETAPDGWEKTSDDCQEVSVAAGETKYCTFNNVKYGQVLVNKYNDRNDNGTRDEGEETLPGWVITLTDQENQTTDSEGNVQFNSLLPGSYQLDEEINPGWTQTNITCDNERNGEITPTPTPFDQLTNILGVDRVFALENGIDGHSVRVSAGEIVNCQIGNHYTTPILQIEKFNNAGGGQTPGGSVVYTLTLKILGNPVYQTILRDLLPNGFVYRPGSWTATRNGNPFSIIEPVYASPGTWNLGDLEMGDEVILTLTADIDSGQKPGLYKDLAWAYGCQEDADCPVDDSLAILANAQDPGFLDDNFVGTDVNVDKDTKSGASVNVTQNITGEVLGASTELPATGAELKWLIFALSLGITGISLIIVSRKLKKYVA